MEGIKRTGRNLVYQGSILDMYEDTMEFADGKSAKWDFIHHEGAAAVLPVTSTGKILMVRQFRNAIDRDALEIPAGLKDSDSETTYETAKRELEEETGYKSDNIEYLLTVISAIAYCDEHVDVYVARDLVKSEQHLDDGEYVEVLEFELDDLCTMIREGKLMDSKTVAAIMAYKVMTLENQSK